MSGPAAAKKFNAESYIREMKALAVKFAENQRIILKRKAIDK
jgi:hypothetical protein